MAVAPRSKQQRQHRGDLHCSGGVGPLVVEGRGRMIQDGGQCRYWPNCSIHDGSRMLPAVVEGRRNRAKLKPNEVVIIREMLAAGAYQREAAARFGVTPETVSAIARGRTWTWLDQ